MSSMLGPIVFGWPMIGLVVFIALVGLTWKRWWLLLVGAVLSLPPVYYLSGNPSINYISFLVPMFLGGAAFAWKNKKMLAGWLLCLPVALATLWLAVLVINQ